MADEKKKNIFDKAVDMLTNRDEKAAVQAAEAAKAEAEKRAAEAEAKAAAMKTEQDREIARQKFVEEQRKRQEEAAVAREAAKPKFIAEHTIKADETLSHVALKHYGNAAREYWMVIYEANKAVIGDNPNIVRPGMVLNIPELPENLKKK